jgi:tripartite-type tricarboxylate transporter receptor subunit TctC
MGNMLSCTDGMKPGRTISEAGVPGDETNSWGGIFVPVRTPRPIVVKLNAEINTALQSPVL